MNKKFIKIITLVLMSFVFGGCPDGVAPEFVPAAYLANKSDHEIIVYWSHFYSAYYPPSLTIYPDTALPKQYFYAPCGEEVAELDSVALHNPLLFVVEPGNSSCESGFETDPLGTLFGAPPHDTLSVFILHADTVRKYSWDEIRDNYNIIVRYDLSKDDVKRFAGYTIPFPPTEAMRDMKMWPPYEEVREKYFHNDAN